MRRNAGGVKLSINKLKGTKVYFVEQHEPWGIFCDVMLNKNGKVVAYIVKTLSIVPISKVIQNRDIDRIENGRIVVKSGTRLVNCELFQKAYRDNVMKLESVKKVVSHNMKSKKLKDMRFEFETGEMCDIVVSQNIITGKHRILVNKIFTKDNTIYI